MTSIANLSPAPLLDHHVTQFTDRVVGAIAWATAVHHGYEFMLRRGERIDSDTLRALVDDVDARHGR